MRTVLQIANAIAPEIGIPQFGALVGNSADQAIRMLAMLNRTGTELSQMTGPVQGWQQLRKEYLFNLVNGQGDYSLPSDFRYLINETGWDRTRKWQLAGPVSPQGWQFLKSGYPATGFLYRFRVMGNKLHFDPVPTSTEQIAIEYYSNAWVLAMDGTTEKQYFTVDSDTPILDDYLIELGAKWRFLRAQGMSYDEEYNEWLDAKERAMARAADARKLNMGSPRNGWMHYIDGTNIPDTGVGM